MRHLEASVAAGPLSGGGARLHIVTSHGEEFSVELSASSAAALVKSLTAAPPRAPAAKSKSAEAI